MKIAFKKNVQKPLNQTTFHVMNNGEILCGIDKRYKDKYDDRYGLVVDNKGVKLCKRCVKSLNLQNS